MSESYIQSHRYRFFAVGAIGTFMGTLEGSILNVALPTLADELSASIDVVAWVILAFQLTVVSLLMVFGTLTQRRGYFFAYRFGYVFFILGSILSAASTTIYMLIGARVVQAIGAAMFQAVGVGLVTTVFPPEERGKGIGMMVMMVSAGLMSGPPAGGFILSVAPWQTIFLINIPIGLVGLFLTYRYLRKLPKPSTDVPLHVGSAVAISIVLGAGVFGLTQLADYPVTSWRVWGMLLLSVVALVTFVRLESDPRKALIGVSIFRNRQVIIAVIGMLVLFISIAGIMILVPFYLERVKGFDPSKVGLFLMILPVVMFVVAPLAGKLSDKIGYRLLTTVGLFLTAFGLYMLHGVSVGSPASYVAWSLLVISIGVGIFNTPNTSALMGSVRSGERAISSSIISATRNVGFALGIALATSLFAYFKSHYGGEGTADEVFVMAYRKVILVSIVVALVGVPLAFFRANRVKKPEGMPPGL
ncbi:MFS transporter [candidate division GN15 bacterium]|nr:MFS transporter [candidate division GN15 bacterium]